MSESLPRSRFDSMHGSKLRDIEDPRRIYDTHTGPSFPGGGLNVSLYCCECCHREKDACIQVMETAGVKSITHVLAKCAMPRQLYRCID